MSEDKGINKAGDWRECYISHYWYFFQDKLRFQQQVCNGFHYMTQKSMSCDDSMIVVVRGHDYRINFWLMTKTRL